MILTTIKRTADLDRGVQKEPLHITFVMGDQEAHRFAVKLVRPASKAAINIEAAGVQGFFMRADGGTVVVDGTGEGDTAIVTLPAACYAVPGRFTIIIRVSLDDTIHSVMIAEGVVSRSRTDVLVDPGNVVPSLDELLARIATLEAVTEEAREVVDREEEAIDSAAAHAANASNSAGTAKDAAEASQAAAEAAREHVNASIEAAQAAAVSSQEAAASAQEAGASDQSARNAANRASSSATSASGYAQRAEAAATRAENVNIPDAIIEVAVNDYLAENPIQGINIDPTLSQPGAAADAAATGEKISRLTGEMIEASIPLVFYAQPLPQTTDEVVMPIRIVIGDKIIEGYGKTKAQGSSSMLYPKKNQTTRLYRDAACTQKLNVSFRNWGEHNKFCLKANWIDFTHARNVVTARLWGDVVRSRPNFDTLPEQLRTSPNYGAIDGFPVLVYAGGVYQGRYTLNIPKDAWMANMDDSLDTHSILCGEGNSGGPPAFREELAEDGDQWTDEIHDTMPTAIRDCLNAAIRFVMNSTDDEFVTDLDHYIDKYSALDYNLLALYDCGIDGMGKNQILLTYDAARLIASAYDLDSTWGLWWDGSKMLPWDYPRTGYEDMVEGRPGNLLYQRIEALMADDLLERWEALKAGPLSVANVLRRFEEFVSIVPPDVVAEDYADTTEYGAYDAIPSIDDNTIQQIRAFAEKRVAWVDNYLANLSTAQADTPVMAEKATWWNAEAAGVEQNTITHIHFSADYEPTGNEDAIWACDTGSAGSIMAYRTGTVITIKPLTARRVKLNRSSNYMFANDGANASFAALQVISGTEMWIADAGTIMDNACISNKALIHPVCVPEGVQYASYMFANCALLRYAPALPATLLSLKSMFSGCESLRALPEIPSACVEISYAFQYCVQARRAPSVVPSAIRNMPRAFYGCSRLNGNIEVNAAALSDYTEAFTGACGVSGSITLSGVSPHLADLAATNTAGKVTVADR